MARKSPRGGKRALQNIHPNVPPAPTLLDPALAHAYANPDDDDDSIDANSDIETVEDQVILDGGLSGLSAWKVFDQAACRKLFGPNGAYICGGGFKKCARQGHNAASEADRHPPIAARQVKVRANSKMTDGDVNCTATIEQYTEQCEVQATTCNDRQ